MNGLNSSFHGKYPAVSGTGCRRIGSGSLRRVILESLSMAGRKALPWGLQSAILLMEGHYLIAHVGDSRVYKIAGTVEQLTEDHSFVAREIKRGNMTEEEAENHPQRNVLIQCVGASGIVTPDILHGRTEKGDVYMLCSVGFRHKLSTVEIYEEFRAENIGSAEIMEDKERYLISRVKTRNERDNITVALMKCEE